MCTCECVGVLVSMSDDILAMWFKPVQKGEVSRGLVSDDDPWPH